MSIVLLPNTPTSSADPYGDGYGKWRPICRKAVDTGYGWATSAALCNGAWWRGDWDQAVHLTGVTLYTRTTGTDDRCPTATVELSDSSTYSVAATASGSSVYVDFGGTKTTTYLKVTFTGTAPGGGNPGWSYIAPEGPGTLVSAGTGSSSADPFGESFDAAKAFDLNGGTSWATSAALCNGAWVMETWGGPQNVTTLILWPRDPSTVAAVDSNPAATVLLSDGSSFNIPATGQGYSSGPGQTPYVLSFGTRKSITTAKVTFTGAAPGGGNPGWFEIEAYDDAVTLPVWAQAVVIA
jgi:hypothetical protein